MIISRNGNFSQNSLFPNSDWCNEGNYIIDETTEQGKQMTQLYIENYPFVDFESEGQRVTEVIVLEKPELPTPNEWQNVQLIQNELGEWVYVLVDRPLSEINLLKQQVKQQQILMDAMLGVSE